MSTYQWGYYHSQKTQAQKDAELVELRQRANYNLMMNRAKRENIITCRQQM